jgi:hypothetical protein
MHREPYSIAPAAATTCAPYCSGKVAVLVRIGDRIFAVGASDDRDAALCALRAVAT